jgi:hypothetical protein
MKLGTRNGPEGSRVAQVPWSEPPERRPWQNYQPRICLIVRRSVRISNNSPLRNGRERRGTYRNVDQQKASS